ncbi:YceI family protein [Chitinophaga nivalis]|uniref:YceI family protein n=1 Tax=Chitinophaga nivalis TaxID=2991709 RepID=A0ABT3IHX6_9BACT|nr:YceI family protein [Chitinophaga nivalis]MCW3466738.1 YceI family protein [Chitinophaga nivalis]MCW3483571.1 YceI family protein [Chitinophaga nivalis]
MKKMMFPVAALLLLVVFAFSVITVQQWRIGSDYQVKFSGKYADGYFKTLKGTVVFDEQNPTAAKFDVVIDVASINTGNWLKNKHARSAKWFDAEKYPEIRFTSTTVSRSGNQYVAQGILDMHGVKKTISIPFTFLKNGAGGVFNGQFKVNRSDFGLSSASGNDSDYTQLTVTVPVTAH